MTIVSSISKRILQKFKMKNSKLVSTPLEVHFKLSTNKSLSPKKKGLMKNILYGSAIGSLISSMA